MRTSTESTPIAFTINDAARRVGVSRSSIYRLAKAGEIEIRKIGGRTVIPAASLDRLIAA